MTRGIPPNDKRCTAKSKRTKKRCGQAAIKNKDKCRFHGGKTPIKHGRRSKYPEAHPEIRQRIAHFKKDREASLSIEKSIFTLRAVSDLIQSKLLKKGKKMTFKDREEVKSLAELLVKTEKETVTAIEKLHRMMFGETHTIKLESLVVWQNQIVDIINEEADEPTRNRIADRISAIRV